MFVVTFIQKVYMDGYIDSLFWVDEPVHMIQLSSKSYSSKSSTGIDKSKPALIANS